MEIKTDLENFFVKVHTVPTTERKLKSRSLLEPEE